MPFEQLFTKVIKRRKPERGKSDGKGIDGKDAKKAESSSSEDEGESRKDWVAVRDHHGRMCWQNRKTGQVYYPANQALEESDSDSDSGGKKGKKPPPPPPPPPAAAMYGPPAMGFMPAPVPPVGFMPSPVPYGVSPVAMYPVQPWNSMPVSPVPMQVPESVMRQHAEAEEKKKKKKEEEEEMKRKIAAGVWERYYTDDGQVFYQHSVTGKKVSKDPYR